VYPEEYRCQGHPPPGHIHIHRPYIDIFALLG
jgi:hypothetical protein